MATIRSGSIAGWKKNSLDNLVGANTDYRTLGEGLYDILSHAIDRVQTVKPGALIEFCNSCTNLASRRYANLYRASDGQSTLR